MSEISSSADGRLMARLRRQRGLARAVLLFERLWPALWPALGLAGAFICLALLELPQSLPPALHAALLAAVTTGIVGLLARGLWRVRLPGAAEADRRLERDSGLSHRPLAVLTDRPALPGAEVLWRAHVARAATALGRLRVGWPHPGLAAHDRRALRGGLVVALVACLVIAGAEAPERLARALSPAFGPTPAEPKVALQAWVTPPAYTNLAPVLLRPEGGAVSVPSGSHLTVSLSGGHGTPALLLGARRLPFQALDATSFQADADLTSGGQLIVRRGGAELGAWDLTVVADSAPYVRWAGQPGVARAGSRVPLTRLPWEVSHAYGVVSLQAELRLKDRPQDPALVVAIPLPGGAPKQAKGVRMQDLTAHPWAGLPVTARLVGRDVPGLVGQSDEMSFTLPERRFDNPIARALLAVRRGLTLHPEQRAPAIAELDRLSDLREVWRDDAGGYLNLRSAAEELLYNGEPSAIGHVQGMLWQLALHLEEGATEKTARALAQARQAVREMLEAEKRGEKLDPKEIDRRIAELERAIQKQLQALAEQLQRDPQAQTIDPQAERLDAEEAQRQAERLKEALEQGRTQDAEHLMAQLERTLEALQNAHPMHRNAQARERQQKRQRGQQQLSAVQDMVQREGGLLDHAQARAQGEPSQGDQLPANPAEGNASPNSQQPQQNTQQQAAPQQADQGRGHDARVQQALRRALGEVMQQYGDLMGQIPPNLGDADQAMREAAQALKQGQDAEAASAAERAIEALQKGGEAMSQQMAAAFGAQGQQEGDADGQDEPGVAFGQPGEGDQPGDNPQRFGGDPFGRHGDRRTDPLGRPLPEGTGGTEDTSNVTLPEQMEHARTRAIQDELRRRSAERSRPQPELDYINRLLKQF